MPKTLTTLADAKKQIKSLGYKTRTVTHSEFKSLKVIDADGVPINAGNVMAPAFFEKHKAFFDYKNGVSVRDGEWIVTL